MRKLIRHPDRVWIVGLSISFTLLAWTGAITVDWGDYRQQLMNCVLPLRIILFVMSGVEAVVMLSIMSIFLTLGLFPFYWLVDRAITIIMPVKE